MLVRQCMSRRRVTQEPGSALIYPCDSSGTHSGRRGACVVGRRSLGIGICMQEVIIGVESARVVVVGIRSVAVSYRFLSAVEGAT